MGRRSTSEGVAENRTNGVPRLRDIRDLAARARAQAAVQRRSAAEDRAKAARDRELSALDRLSYAQELASFELDELTGALRRRVGLAALQREMDRTLRATERLTVVFIDVDGLKRVNDTEGHAAGDALLCAVVRCISDEFRSYDLMFRLGGDEFVCSISGGGLSGIHERFKRVAERLHEAVPGATISIGVSERQPDDTVEGMIERADAAMIAARREVERRESQ
jgi:diguanylate cyclase (GGDEF)-like protein